MADTDKCVSCGGYVPEGRQVCSTCLDTAEHTIVGSAISNLKEAKSRIEKAIAKLTLAEGGRS